MNDVGGVDRTFSGWRQLMARRTIHTQKPNGAQLSANALYRRVQAIKQAMQEFRQEDVTARPLTALHGQMQATTGCEDDASRSGLLENVNRDSQPLR